MTSIDTLEIHLDRDSEGYVVENYVIITRYLDGYVDTQTFCCKKSAAEEYRKRFLANTVAEMDSYSLMKSWRKSMACMECEKHEEVSQ